MHAQCSSCGETKTLPCRGICKRCYQRAYSAGTLLPRILKPKAPRRGYRMPDSERPCAKCGALVLLRPAEANRTKISYCSDKCRSGDIDHTCPGCGASFVTKRSRLRQGVPVYCTKNCWRSTRRRLGHIERSCLHCRMPFAVKRSQAAKGRGHYCSLACYTAALPPGCEARKRPRVQGWRREVFERDGYRCTQCAATGSLNAHHIKPWAQYPELRRVLANGVTLCQHCHRLAHDQKVSPEAQAA